MKPKAGRLIVLDGSDGSGKTTQLKLLAKRLEAIGHEVAVFAFPQYEQPSAYFVSKYLSGGYGQAKDINPYTASLFYALDRFEAGPAIKSALEEGKIVLTGRYVGANMAHQGGKFEHAEEQRGFFIWEDSLEFEILGIPRPDLNIYLRVPAEISQKLIKERAAQEGTTPDEHEADFDHLKNAVATYDRLCKLFPKDFVAVDCVEAGELLSITAINNRLWELVKPRLPKKDRPPAATEESTAPAAAPSAEGPLIRKNDDSSFTITEAGRQYLAEAVTDPTGQVYAFTAKLSPVTIAAAMARLSRRGDDLRITLLDEFAGQADKDEQLLNRVITAYGDDSVQQLAGLHVVVEDASNLLTKKLEWGRLAAYLEQSTRYIYYDQKDERDRYKFFVPAGLDAKTRASFVQTLNQILDLYSKVVHKLTDYVGQRSSVPEAERDGAWRAAVRAQACDAARPMLPVAVKSTVGVFASGQALESLIMHLLADELKESKATGQKLLNEARKVMPVFLERADKPDRGGALTAYLANTRAAVKRLADKLLPSGHAPTGPEVQLLTAWPRNELDLVPDMLYEHSDLPLAEIEKTVAGWPYAKRVDVFKAYLGERLNRRHRPGRALEKAHYSWDLVCDYGIFRDLQRHRMVDDLAWQNLTPRYGYDVPKLVDEANMSDQFNQAFDKSLALHSQLQSRSYDLEAQYATLFGHKLRWKITYNAREAFHLHELRTSPQGHPGYRQLVQLMHEKLGQVHPLLAEAMKFVNQDEDPELTRLAAERYSQFKLQQLEQAPQPAPAQKSPRPSVK